MKAQAKDQLAAWLLYAATTLLDWSTRLAGFGDWQITFEADE